MRAFSKAAISLVLFLAAALPIRAQTAPQAPSGNNFIGSLACQACHPDVWQTFPRNPHFKSVAAANQPPEQTGCEGCHGPGQLHVQGGGDKTKITLFPELPPAKVLDNCLNCHAKDLGKTEIRRSAHSQAEVSCVSCHSIHGSPEIKNLLADTQRQVCYDCHRDIQARFNLPFSHPVNEGAMECSDCHNPHGAPTATWWTAQSPRMVKHAFGNDIACTGCHTDKKGPFVFEHAPVRVEGCPTCHNPHGSVNPRLLNRPAVFTMCLECHNGVMGFGKRGEGIPSPGSFFHDIRDPSFQNCVTCHSRIHGSNSDRLFRR